MATITLTALESGGGGGGSGSGSSSVELLVSDTAEDIIVMMQDYPTQTFLKLDDGTGSFVYINRNQIIKIV
jgi:hypothetical protein